MEHTSATPRHSSSRILATAIVAASFSLPFMIAIGNAWGTGIIVTLLIIAIGRYAFTYQPTIRTPRKLEVTAPEVDPPQIRAGATNLKTRLEESALSAPTPAATEETQLARMPLPEQPLTASPVPTRTPSTVSTPLGVASVSAPYRTPIPVTTQAISRPAPSPAVMPPAPKYEIPSRAGQIFIGYDMYHEEVWIAAGEWRSSAPTIHKSRNATKSRVSNRPYRTLRSGNYGDDYWDDDDANDGDCLDVNVNVWSGYAYFDDEEEGEHDFSDAFTGADLYDPTLFNLGDLMDDGHFPSEYFDSDGNFIGG